jgi:pentapeptide repeat protein
MSLVKSYAQAIFINNVDKIGHKIESDLLSVSEQEILDKLHREVLYDRYVPIDPIRELLLPIAAGEDQTFGLMQNALIDLIIKTAEPNPEKNDKLIDQISDEALALFNTSVVLGRLIHSLSGKLQRENLDSVCLLTADLRGLSLGDVNFASSFIAGDGTGVDLGGAHLENANLSNIVFDKTDLSYASLNGATLPGPGISLDGYGFLARTNLTGANWWDTRNIFSRHTAGASIELDPDGKVAGFSSLSECPASETSVVKKEDRQVTPDKPATEVSVTSFSIVLCPDEKQIAAAQLNFEDAFPRQRNEQQRNDWLKRKR